MRSTPLAVAPLEVGVLPEGDRQAGRAEALLQLCWVEEVLHDSELSAVVQASDRHSVSAVRRRRNVVGGGPSLTVDEEDPPTWTKRVGKAGNEGVQPLDRNVADPKAEHHGVERSR